MSIEEAKAIDLVAFLARMGFEPEEGRSRAHDKWYLSPFRTEKTPSFHINTRLNAWKDFGESGKGGDIINFVQLYYERTGRGALNTAEALAEIERLTGARVPLRKKAVPTWGGKPEPIKAPRLMLLSFGPLRDPALCRYLEHRKLPEVTVRPFLQEVHYYDTQSARSLCGLGWRNLQQHWEVRSPGRKTCLGTKDISVIRFKKNPYAPTAIFEGMMDFLSLLVLEPEEALHTALILNSNAMTARAIEWLREKHDPARPLLGYFDNDRAGIQAALDMREAFPELALKNPDYIQYRDLNDALRRKKMPSRLIRTAEAAWDRS